MAAKMGSKDTYQRVLEWEKQQELGRRMVFLKDAARLPSRSRFQNVEAQTWIVDGEWAIWNWGRRDWHDPGRGRRNFVGGPDGISRSEIEAPLSLHL